MAGGGETRGNTHMNPTLNTHEHIDPSEFEKAGETMQCSHGFHCALVRLRLGIFRPDVSSLLL